MSARQVSGVAGCGIVLRACSDLNPNLLKLKWALWSAGQEWQNMQIMTAGWSAQRQSSGRYVPGTSVATSAAPESYVAVGTPGVLCAK